MNNLLSMTELQASQWCPLSSCFLKGTSKRLCTHPEIGKEWMKQQAGLVDQLFWPFLDAEHH